MLAIVLLFAITTGGSDPRTPSDLTPLMKAVAKNDLKDVRTLLAHGAAVNQKAKGGETALYEAIERLSPTADDLPIVDALLQAGADPNEPAIFGASPLVLSLTRDYSNPQVTLRLIQAGAEVSRSCVDDDGLVSLATQDSSVAVVTALIEKGAPVNCQTRYGFTALHWAALNGEHDQVGVLLEHGADPRLRNKEGKSALDLAMTTNPQKSVQARFSKTRELLQHVSK